MHFNMFWYAKKIAMFKEKYNRFFYELLSDEFSNMIEKYFNELKNDILNYGQEKILSINKYYFNKSLYDDLFYLIDQSNKEALHLIDNINNFFNETTLIILKVNTSQLIDDSLSPFNEKKLNQIDNLFNSLYEDIPKTNKLKSCDNDDLYYEWWILPFFGTAYKNKNCPHTNNINLVKIYLNEVNIFLKNRKNIIFNNFIKK